MAAKLRAHQVDVDPDFAPQSRPRSCTWPLPQPDDLAADEDAGALGSGVAEAADDCGPEPRHRTSATSATATLPTMAPAPPLGAEVGPLRKAKSSRRNAWGNLSYADLITKAIESAPDKRLTLSQIYDWMVRYVPYFKDKGDSNSSAGWKVWGRRAGDGVSRSRGHPAAGSWCWRWGLGSIQAGLPSKVGEAPGLMECVPAQWCGGSPVRCSWQQRCGRSERLSGGAEGVTGDWHLDAPCTGHPSPASDVDLKRSPSP